MAEMRSEEALRAQECLVAATEELELFRQVFLAQPHIWQLDALGLLSIQKVNETEVLAERVNVAAFEDLVVEGALLFARANQPVSARATQ